MKRLALLLTLSIICCVAAFTQEEDKREKWRALIPEFDGTVRAKYEYQPQMKASRFQVRNARFSINGKVHPIAGYKLEIDLSDQGRIRMLDAYARLTPIEGGSFTIGQMRVPFTIDAHRSPHLQYFANRSFIAKQVGDVRDVGFTLEYKFTDFPLILQGGIFNGFDDITADGQKRWTHKANYSFKAQVFPVECFNITLSTQKIAPLNNNIFMHDIGSYVNIAGLHLEAEYLYKHYTHGKFKDVHSVNAFANYDIPLKRVFHKISILARYDMMTDHWDGVTVNKETGAAVMTDSQRHRATGGVTLSLAKPFKADIRVNYEKYFYEDGALINESEQDKLVFEIMLRF